MARKRTWLAAGVGLAAVGVAARPVARRLAYVNRSLRLMENRIYSWNDFGPEVEGSGLTAQLFGQAETGFSVELSGFWPGEPYHTEVRRPDGTQYTYIKDGYADLRGCAPYWFWDCYDTGYPAKPRDDEGNYQLTISGKWSGRRVSLPFPLFYRHEE